MIDLTLEAIRVTAEMPTRVANRLRRRRLLRRFASVGQNFIFDATSLFMTPELLHVGDNVFIGPRAYISADARIGNNVMFGPSATIIGGDHYFAVRGKSVRFMHPRGQETLEPITIEDETWCGASVTVLGGVTLGTGCVIGAGSVVTKSIPPYVVAAGVYCRPIRRIFADDGLLQHVMQLGETLQRAEAIVARRRDELTAWGLECLGSTDRTSSYWEYQEREL